MAITIPAPVSIPLPVAAFTAEFPFPFTLFPSCAPLLTFLFPDGVFLKLLLPPLFSSLLLFLFLDFTLQSSLLLLHQSELFTYAFPLCTTRGSLGCIVFVRLGAADTLFFGRLVAYLCTSKFAEMSLERVGIDEALNNGLCLLVDFVSIEGAVDESRCFASVE